MVIFLRLVAAVLLWAALYALTPDFGNVWIDAAVPLMLAAASVALVFWVAPLEPPTRG